jgi:hypothetical protein
VFGGREGGREAITQEVDGKSQGAAAVKMSFRRSTRDTVFLWGGIFLPVPKPTVPNVGGGWPSKSDDEAQRRCDSDGVPRCQVSVRYRISMQRTREVLFRAYDLYILANLFIHPSQSLCPRKENHLYKI